jgi:predicted small lipoprotein YifL
MLTASRLFVFGVTAALLAIFSVVSMAGCACTSPVAYPPLQIVVRDAQTQAPVGGATVMVTTPELSVRFEDFVPESGPPSGVYNAWMGSFSGMTVHVTVQREGYVDFAQDLAVPAHSGGCNAPFEYAVALQPLQ